MILESLRCYIKELRFQRTITGTRKEGLHDRGKSSASVKDQTVNIPGFPAVPVILPGPAIVLQKQLVGIAYRSGRDCVPINFQWNFIYKQPQWKLFVLTPQFVKNWSEENEGQG